MIVIAKDLEFVEVVSRRHVAQGEGDPYHGGCRRVDQVHVLDPLIAQAPPVQGRHQGWRGDLLELVARLQAQLRHRLFLATRYEVTVESSGSACDVRSRAQWRLAVAAQSGTVS